MAERFVGRTAELSSLLAAWQKVVATGTPEVAALLGESGVGKTRLVQAFYASLVASHRSPEGRGYWPAELDVRGRNLTVNPDLALVDSREVPPFLWWGIRIPDPLNSETTTASAVRSHLPHLIPHLEPMLRARAVKRLLLAGGMEVGATVSGYIPVIGSTLEVVKAGFELFETIRGAWSDPALSPSVARERAQRNLIDTVVGDVAAVMRSHDRGRALPLVLVIDDAQFANRDPSSVEMLMKLLDEGHRMGWPLLVVLTYWQEPWAIDWRGPQPATTIAAVVRDQHQRRCPDWRPIPLGVMPPEVLEPWLRDRLPGLSTA